MALVIALALLTVGCLLGVGLKHFGELSRNLDRAVDSYNTTVGSLEVRVLPGARRFKELGAAAGEDIPALPTLHVGTRTLRAPELDPLLAEQAGLPES